MATTSNPFSGTGDVTGFITGGARRGDSWDFMDQRGNVLTSVPYQTFVDNYQSDGSGAVRSGVTSVNGVPVYNFSGAQTTAAPSAGVASTPQASTANLVTNPLSPQPNTFTTSASGATLYTPMTSNVNRATETSAGQIESLLANDSPLLQRARTEAQQNMNRRGLVNSSMAQGAGVAAMIDRVTPLALQDAQIYAQRATENMQEVNKGGIVNASEQNKFGLQKGEQAFEDEQAKIAREFTTSERLGSQKFQRDQLASQQNFSGTQADLDRAHQASLQQADAAFRATQAQLDRQQQEAMMRLSNAMSQASVSSNFAASIMASTSASINAILADPNLTPEAKRGAVDNIIASANSTLQWGSSFYNTPIPPVPAPGAAPSNAPRAPAPAPAPVPRVPAPAPVSGGIVNPAAEAAAAVRTAYINYVGRVPTTSELTYWTGTYSSLNPVSQIVANIAQAARENGESGGSSAPAAAPAPAYAEPASAVRTAYINNVGREPTTSELAYWTGTYSSLNPVSQIVANIAQAARENGEI